MDLPCDIVGLVFYSFIWEQCTTRFKEKNKPGTVFAQQGNKTTIYAE